MLVKTTMLLGLVGLTAMACSDSLKWRWLMSTLAGTPFARRGVGPRAAPEGDVIIATAVTTANGTRARRKRFIPFSFLGAREGYPGLPKCANAPCCSPQPRERAFPRRATMGAPAGCDAEL